jgi:hypothetical protein
MGGHGTWQLGAHFPGLFAAIGPSAGWISFWSYAGAPRYENPNDVESILSRASNASDTLSLKSNFANEAVYVLHGSADDNVPVTEARAMANELQTFHKDWVLFEQPGAGHWWENSDEPGAECVDWPPMFDMFQRRRLSQLPREVHFTTISPGISPNFSWVTVLSQEHAFVPSEVRLRFDPLSRRVNGTTVNVSAIQFDLAAGSTPGSLRITLDGAQVETEQPASKPILLRREGGSWRVSSPKLEWKNPQRYGPFKEAFRNRAVLVYGTIGTPAENAWSYARARYDAETFYYRGNGAFDLVPDTSYARLSPDRSVILYGNEETNTAWKLALPNSPIQVTRRGVRVGKRQLPGKDIACLFIRPRPRSFTASVGVVSGTTLSACRLTERMPYFVAGVSYPDFIAFSPQTLTTGTKGVLCAGFFGEDWTVERGDFAFR